MSTPVAVTVPASTPVGSTGTSTGSTVSTAHAVKLAQGKPRSERRLSRHRHQRAARIYTGSMNMRDKLATYPDKGWALLILAGVGMVTYALGCATVLVVESLLGITG